MVALAPSSIQHLDEELNKIYRAQSMSMGSEEDEQDDEAVDRLSVLR